MPGKHPQEPPLALLLKGAAALRVPLPPLAREQFHLYLTELKRWNQKVNLTSLTTDRDIVVKHFLDSLAILPFLPPVAALADLGSGAGFPGLVLKLARPELALTLVEARGKKAAFLEYLVALFKLTGVEVRQVHLTPALARDWGPRFAAVTSRATFPLVKLMALAAPLLLPGGVLLALKGPNLDPGELEQARRRGESLNLGSLSWHSYHLPISGEPRLLVRAYRGESAGEGG